MPCFQLFLNFSHNCSPGHNTNGLPKQKYLCLVGVSGFGCDRDLWILHFRFYGRKTEHYLQKEKNNPFGVLLLIRCCWCGSRTLRPPRVETKLWLFSAHSLKPTCCKGVVLSFQWDHTVAFAVIKKFQSFSFCRLLFSPGLTVMLWHRSMHHLNCCFFKIESFWLKCEELGQTETGCGRQVCEEELCWWRWFINGEVGIFGGVARWALRRTDTALELRGQTVLCVWETAW